MKKWLSILLLTALLLGILCVSSAFAETQNGYCGPKLTWMLDENGVLTISGTGPMTDYGWGESPFFANENVHSVVILNGVTSIGNNAFTYCPITSVSLPDSLNRIEEGAFFDNGSLKEITIPLNVDFIALGAFNFTLEAFHVSEQNKTYSAVDGVLFNKTGDTLIQYPDYKPDAQYAVPEGVAVLCDCAFNNCEYLVNVTLPESLVSIGDFAFHTCPLLENVVIPKNVQSIGHDAFTNSENLVNIQADADNAYFVSIDGVLFNKSLDMLIQYPAGRNALSYQIPGGVTTIRHAAFYVCHSLTSVSIPESVRVIESEAFAYCDQLTSVQLPSGLRNLSWALFSHCSSLTELVVPSGVWEIDDEVFRCCDSLTSVILPPSVYLIGDTAFAECSDDLKLVVRANSYAHQFAIDNGIHYALDASPAAVIGSGSCGENVTWTLDEDGVLTISGTGPMTDYNWGSSPFFDNKKIHSVIIEDGVTSVGSNAFVYSGVASISLPDSMIRIEEDAFSWIDSLQEIKLPKNVSFVSRNAFNGSVSAFRVAEENQTFSAVNGVLFSKTLDSLITYPDRKQDAHYDVPEGITVICDCAFADCNDLTSVTLPDSLIIIGDYAFNAPLESITIPSSVQSIGFFALAADQRKSIHVDPNNPNYASKDGVLFNKSMDRLIQYPAGRSAATYQVPESISCIGITAFWGCGSLRSITIPNSVTAIESQAFCYCSQLSDVTLPNSLKSIDWAVFRSCGALTGLVIPASVTEIQDSAFEDCSSLTAVTIPASVASISDSAFAYCSNALTLTVRANSCALQFAIDHGIRYELDDSPDAIVGSGVCGKDVTWTLDEEGVLTISGIGQMWDYDGDSAPWASARETIRKAVIGNGVTSIGAWAFADCSQLTEMVLPSSLEAIHTQAFTECWNLKTINFPSGLSTIEAYAFQYSGLTEINLPESLESLPYRVFFGCSNLTSVFIPANITYISGGAFSDCTRLKSIEVSADNAYYTSQNGVLFDISMTELVQCPAGKTGHYTIPDGVVTIDDRAFSSCQYLEDIIIPFGVTSIGFDSFCFCDGLTSLALPYSLAYIEEGAFCFCYHLESITIPPAVTHIGDYAFESCDSLTIYGYTNTTAQAYAQENGIPFEPLGCAHVWGPADVTLSPTETDEGTVAHMCTVCGMMKTFQIPALGNMRVLRLPASLTSIEAEAFAGLNIQAVLIPDGCVSVDSRAFADCPSLLYVRAPMGTVFAAQSFDGCSDNLVIERIAP